MTLFKILISLISCLMFSCTSKTTQDLQKVLGHTLTIPAGMTAHVQKRDTTLSLCDSAAKLVVYYNFQGCSSCKLKELIYWNDYLEELDSIAPQIQPVFIMNTGNKEVKTKTDLIVYQFKHPVLFDKIGEFEAVNLLPKDPILHTFLLDKYNKVVLIGSPINNPKMWDLYKSAIQKLIDNGGILTQK